MSQHSARDRRWMKLRKQKLEHENVCEYRDTSGERCLRTAHEVDHIVPQSEWPDGRYDWSNLRALCRDHHLIVHGKHHRPVIDPVTGWAE